MTDIKSGASGTGDITCVIPHGRGDGYGGNTRNPVGSFGMQLRQGIQGKAENLFRLCRRRRKNICHAGSRPSGTAGGHRRGSGICGAAHKARHAGAAGRTGSSSVQRNGLPRHPAA